MPDDFSGITREYGDSPRTVDHPNTDLNVTNINQRSGRSVLDIGDLRRSYDFGLQYTELAPSRDVFLHILNATTGVQNGRRVSLFRKPTGDSKFQYTIKRKYASLWRYGYIVGITAAGEVVSGDVSITSASTAWGNTPYRAFLDASITGIGDDAFANATVPTSQNDLFAVAVMGDYKTSGMLANRIDASGGTKTYTLGQSGTKPVWFLPDQTIKIPTGAATAGTGSFGTIAGYVVAKIKSVYDLVIYASDGTTVLGEGKILNVRLERADSTNKYPTSVVGNASWSKSNAELLDVSHGVGTNSVAQKLEPCRTYISGTGYHELAGYGNSTPKQQYSTDYGFCQIFKKTAMLSGRAMATVLKFGRSPWAEEWEDKMLENNWEIGQTMYFGEQYEDADGVMFTEGYLSFAMDNAHLFSLSTSTKDLDDFLEDFSAFNDPRIRPQISGTTVYLVRSDVWNWFAMLGGFRKNTLAIGDYSTTFNRFSVAFTGMSEIAGLRSRDFDIDGKTIHVLHDSHLDGTHAKMIAADLRGCFIRPFIGNENRDVHVYPGVKTINNSGQDYRVDLIQGDLGFEWGVPEGQAVWL